MCEEVKGEAQICRFYGFEFPEQEVHSIKEIIEKAICLDVEYLYS